MIEEGICLFFILVLLNSCFFSLFLLIISCGIEIKLDLMMEIYISPFLVSNHEMIDKHAKSRTRRGWRDRVIPGEDDETRVSL